jgi:hypothetical protein
VDAAQPTENAGQEATYRPAETAKNSYLTLGTGETPPQASKLLISTGWDVSEIRNVLSRCARSARSKARLMSFDIKRVLWSRSCPSSRGLRVISLSNVCEGFRDASGTYGTREGWSGVGVTIDRPWNLADGGTSPRDDPAPVVIEVPMDLFVRYEWSGCVRVRRVRAIAPEGSPGWHSKVLKFVPAPKRNVTPPRSG